MIKIFKKILCLSIILFSFSTKLPALNLEEEIAYYKNIQKPLEELLEDLKNFVGIENSGIFFRTVNDKINYKTTNYYATHYNELYDFYAEKLFCLIHLNIEDPFLIENDDSIDIRQKTIDAIELIVYELEEICKAYLLPEKLDKISKMSQPNIGYKGTLTLFQKIKSFVEKNKNILNHIYKHERDIIIYFKSTHKTEPNIVPLLNLPILQYENIKKSCKDILKNLDNVIAFYVEKFNAFLELDIEEENIKKDKKNSIFDRFTRKKKDDESIAIEADPIDVPIDPNDVIQKKRNSSSLKALSPRTQSLKKISIDTINKEDIEVHPQSAQPNTNVQFDATTTKKRSTFFLKTLTPRASSPKSTYVDGLNRGASDSKLSPKKILPDPTPRPKSEEIHIIRKNKSNSFTHSDLNLTSKIQKLELSSNHRQKTLIKAPKNAIEIISPKKKEKKKDKKKNKKKKKKE